MKIAEVYCCIADLSMLVVINDEEMSLTMAQTRTVIALAQRRIRR